LTSLTLCPLLLASVGLLTAFLTIVIALVIMNLINLSPLTTEFFLSAVMCALGLRLVYLFEAELIFHLLSGYELDQGLVLHQSEKSVMDYIPLFSKRLAPLDDPDNLHQQKYATFHSREELNLEIQRLQRDIRLKQTELAYVENLMFAVSDSSVSRQYAPPAPPALVEDDPLSTNKGDVLSARGADA
jgi:hypothetical protein